MAVDKEEVVKQKSEASKLDPQYFLKDKHAGKGGSFVVDPKTGKRTQKEGNK